MERLLERITSAEKALNAFNNVMLIKDPSDIERDAAIQRFEFTFEACWKASKQYLYDIEGVDVGSPKSVIRASREVNLFDELETMEALNMVNDRNLTVHTYNEEVAMKIHSNLNMYFTLLSSWINRIKQRLA